MILLILSLFFSDPAIQLYEEGVKAPTRVEQQQKWNEALTTYLNLEQQYPSEKGDGILFYNIGTTYAALEQYPEAVYYLYKARNLRPLDPKVEQNLNLSLAQLNLPKVPQNEILSGLPLPSQLQFFTFLLFMALAWISASIWYPISLVKGMAWIMTFFVLLFCFYLGYIRYFSPLEGVLIKSALILQGPGENFVAVVEEPIVAGQKVKIVNTSGEWVLIENPQGKMGYVPTARIKIL